MAEPWDRPPYPKRGNSERVLFEAVGRCLMGWEEVEGTFAHLFSTFRTGLPFDTAANKEYGQPLNFVHRVQALRDAACRYFQSHCSQENEGEFAEIVELALNWSQRRNDVAHGRARMIHWIINPESRETLLTAQGPLRWCVIPPHFKSEKFTEDDRPTYVLTSREMNRFADAFWKLSVRINKFMHRIETPSDASFGRFVLPPLSNN